MTNNFCSNCGQAAIDLNANFCAGCGAQIHSSQTESTSSESYSNENYQSSGQHSGQTYNENRTYARPDNVVYVKEKSTFVSIILSFIFPGAGQVYNGNLKKGIYMMIGFWIGLFVFVFPGIIVWVYNMYDAYQDAEKINRGELPFIDPTAKDAVIYAITYIAAFFIIYIVFAIITAIIMLPFMFL
ncbi:hypothetical protein MmiHf6_16800 [Methanimicrococcus hongohii]|uniref:Zinc-ribbon domain-containing protein n=1 Tax=Methanimicrococcus hongohii TaxID=3028295 RepID=A0AA96ZTB3_9EURY|nr:zinc ribbon domain-containing protein [Methanimicrococcus sp. Hf6]WNY24349.1 hypothetical protein MmiHf6_16800 [Methanimicrococcus sp. Hf6]